MNLKELMGNKGLIVAPERKLTTAKASEAIADYAKHEEARKKHKFTTYFPDEGPFRRELYPRHMEFFKAGKSFRSRLFRAANRVGKTCAVAYELTCHLTGLYPPWWEGYRFDGPIEAWAANISWEKVRDVNQNELLGNPQRPEETGTGFIPPEYILRFNYHGFVKYGCDTIAVRHVPTKKVSLCQFKAYTQGRESFESNAKHFVWGDEEMDADIFTACELRTMTTGGLIALSYTPILGLTPLTEMFEAEGEKI